MFNLLIYSIPFYVLAQTTSVSFTNYSIANGLCYNYVYDIVQDSRSFMWFGTAEGLSRFDGTNFKNFYADNNNSFPVNQINYLHEYKKDHLVFTSGMELWCMNTITMQFYQPAQFKNKGIGFIRRDKKGLYFIKVSDSCFITNNLLQITDTIISPAKTKTGIEEVFYLDENKLLVKIGEKNFFYDLNTKKYQLFPLVINDNTNHYSFDFRLYDARNCYLYFSRFSGGLYKFSLTGDLLHHWTQIKGTSDLTIVGSVLQINDSTIWAGTAANGVNVINIHNNAIIQIIKNNNNLSSLASNLVTCIYKDADHNIWLGTDNGISKLNNTSTYIKSWHWQFDPSDRHNELIDILKGPDKNMYLSFYQGNTYQLNTANDLVSKMNNDMFAYPWSLHTCGNEIYKTGAGNSVFSYNTRTGQYKKLDFLKKYFPDVELIVAGFTHSNGDEWYSGNHGGGFVRIDTKDSSYHIYKKDGEHGSFISSYYPYHTETPNGDLWFGVNKSSRLLHWNKATDLFNEIEFANVLGTKPELFGGITAVASDNKNNIWVGFQGNGVVKYDPVADTAGQYTMLNGLTTNNVSALQFDNKNRLWIGTTNGLSCLLTDRKKIITFKKEDGLPEDKFEENCSYFDSLTNKLWFGASSTLMCFNPDILLSINKNNFPVYIDELFVNGKKYITDSPKEIKLNPSQNNLQFQFIGVDIANGKDIEYSYELAGADKDWIYNGTITSASYSNLNPGHYTFKVRAKHKGDNVWTEIEQPLSFYIKTPWNKSWWFILLAFAAAGLVIASIIRAYYLRRIENQNAIIEKQNAISSERSRIAADMHDDMGAGLSRIRYLSAAMKNDIHDEGVKKELDKLIAGSDELVDKMNEIIWTLNSSDETLEDTIYYIRSQCSEILDLAKINFEYSLPDFIPNKLVSSEEKRNLYLVVKEAVHNATKHSGATKVGLHVQITGQFCISVDDNGIGFNAEQDKLKGNGLSNYKKRMALLKGTVKIESGKSGTKVIFKIPLL